MQIGLVMIESVGLSADCWKIAINKNSVLSRKVKVECMRVV